MKKIIAAFALSLMLVSSASALTLEGVKLPDTMSAGGTELQLNGAGVRDKWFIDLYVGGLYLSKAENNAQKIIGADEPQAISLHIVSGLISSEKMTDATLEGFEAATDGNMKPIQKEIDRFMAVFDDEINEGDVFAMTHLPGEGVQVSKNWKPQDTIPGMAFKKALFGIWLSDDPAQEDLKEAMLGGEPG